jgi:hypothetical protein
MSLLNGVIHVSVFVHAFSYDVAISLLHRA